MCYFLSYLSQPVHSQLAACPNRSNGRQGQGLEMNGCGDDMGTDGGRSNIGRIVAVAAVIRAIGRVRADARIIWGPSQGTNLIVRVFHAGVASRIPILEMARKTLIM